MGCGRRIMRGRGTGVRYWWLHSIKPFRIERQIRALCRRAADHSHLALPSGQLALLIGPPVASCHPVVLVRVSPGLCSATHPDPSRPTAGGTRFYWLRATLDCFSSSVLATRLVLGGSPRRAGQSNPSLPASCCPREATQKRISR